MINRAMPMPHPAAIQPSSRHPAARIKPNQNNIRQTLNNYIRNSAKWQSTDNSWMSEMQSDLPIQVAENNFDAILDQICKKKIDDNKAADLNSPIRWSVTLYTFNLRALRVN